MVGEVAVGAGGGGASVIAVSSAGGAASFSTLALGIADPLLFPNMRNPTHKVFDLDSILKCTPLDFMHFQLEKEEL